MLVISRKLFKVDHVALKLINETEPWLALFLNSREFFLYLVDAIMELGLSFFEYVFNFLVTMRMKIILGAL